VEGRDNSRDTFYLRSNLGVNVYIRATIPPMRSRGSLHTADFFESFLLTGNPKKILVSSCGLNGSTRMVKRHTVTKAGGMKGGQSVRPRACPPRRREGTFFPRCSLVALSLEDFHKLRELIEQFI